MACLVLAGAVRAEAQTLEGVLLERGTNRPINLGLVTLLTMDGDSVQSSLTNQEGRFRVESPEPGEFRLAASALGYRSTVAGSVFTLDSGAFMSLQFRVEPAPVELEELTVEARTSLISQPKLVTNGFVDRVERGFGRFLTPREIERSGAMSTSELLTRTGRITTRYSIGGDRIVMLGPRGYCTPLVWVDGAQVSLQDTPIDAIVGRQDLEGVEVYRTGSEAPLQYGGTTGGCGVIVLWTRAR